MIRMLHKESGGFGRQSAVDSTFELPAELKSRFENTLGIVRQYIKEGQWREVTSLVRSFSDDDPLITQTDLLPRLHEELYKVPGSAVGDHREFYDFLKDWQSFDSAASIVEKMGLNPSHIPYLRKIINEDRIPAIALEDGHKGLIDLLNAGGDEDSDIRWLYYRYVCGALANVKSAEAIEAIGLMLKKIYRQQQELAEKHRAYNASVKDMPEFIPAEGEVHEMTDEEFADFKVKYPSANFGENPETPQQYYAEKLDQAETGWSSEDMAGMWAGDDAFYTKERIVQKLRETGRLEVVPIIIEIIKNEGIEAPNYFTPILEAFEKLDQNIIAHQLLELAKSNNEYEKRSALWLLYRLEIGQVGISEDGARYLQKVYDVGNFNSPNYYAERITSGGEVGIFSQSGAFQKYFRLQGLDSEQQRIEAQLLDITYATLYGPHVKETADERLERERFLDEFRAKYFEFFHGEFFDDLPVKFNDLSFQEQGQFMNFFEGSDQATRQRISRFSKRFGLSGFRTFLSLDYDQEMGGRILDMAERLTFEQADRIFRKYSEILASADMAEQGLADVVLKTDLQQPGALMRIKESLLTKAKDLLVNFSQISNDEKKPYLLKRLDAYRSEIAFYSSAVSELARDKKLSISEIIARKVVIKDSANLDEAEKSEMLGTFIEGRRVAYQEDLWEGSINKFEKRLNEKGHKFYILEHEGHPLVFLHTDQESADTLYAGSFNLSPSARHGPWAVAFLKAWVTEVGAKKNIRADVLADNTVARKLYTKLMGFKEVGSHEVMGPSGKKHLYIDLMRYKTSGAAAKEV